MKHEFRVIYTLPGSVVRLECDAIAKDEEGARAAVMGCLPECPPEGPEEYPEIRIISVTHVRAVLDWDQRIFNREEGAVFLRKSAAWVDKAMARGDLPKARNGNPVFPREVLESYVRKEMAA